MIGWNQEQSNGGEVKGWSRNYLNTMVFQCN